MNQAPQSLKKRENCVVRDEATNEAAPILGGGIKA
jgi:hypothetical protein